MDTTVAPLASIGVDIGKEVFHLVGFGTDGKIAFRRKVKRLALIETFKKLAPCVVGMEACSRRLPELRALSMPRYFHRDQNGVQYDEIGVEYSKYKPPAMKPG